MKKVELGTIVKFTINELTDSIIDSNKINIQDIIKIVKQLDIKSSNLKFTNDCYRYFKEEMDKEV